MNKEKIASDKSLEELFRPSTRWENIKWFPIRIWTQIEYKWEDFIAFFQRGKRGYADKDVWNFDYYLSKVILGGLKLLKETHSGYPTKLTDEKWNAILDEMIEGFENRINVESYEEYLIKNGENKLNKSLQLFAKHFGSLWD